MTSTIGWRDWLLRVVSRRLRIVASGTVSIPFIFVDAIGARRGVKFFRLGKNRPRSAFSLDSRFEDGFICVRARRSIERSLDLRANMRSRVRASRMEQPFRFINRALIHSRASRVEVSARALMMR